MSEKNKNKNKKTNTSFVSSIDPSKLLYSINTCKWSAIKLNSKYVYRHVWKSGGTTIGQYTKLNQTYIDDSTISNNNSIVWFTLVRDPISHFLSGWSEVQARAYKHNKNNIKDLHLSYDTRITNWLNIVKTKYNEQQIQWYNTSIIHNQTFHVKL